MFSDKKILSALGEYKYLTELHCHSNPASACANFPADEVVRTYSELGYDSLALTNHYYIAAAHDGEDREKYFERYFGDYHLARSEGEKVGIKVLLGLEIRFTDCLNDYLVFGISESEARDILPHLTILAQFRSEYKNENMLVIQAHPYRDGMSEVDTSLLDGVEILNLHPGHNSRVAYAARMSRTFDGVVTSGSDYHHAGMGGLGGIYTRERIEDSIQLARVLRSGDYLLDFGGYPVIPQAMERGNK